MQMSVICGTAGSKHCTMYEAFTAQLLLDMQAVRLLPQCGWLSLLLHDAALHRRESGTSGFETIVLSCNTVTNQPVMQCHITEEQRSFFWFVHWLLWNGLIHIIRPTGNVKSKLMKQHTYQGLYQVLKRKFSSGVCSYTWQFCYGKCDVLCAWYVGLAFDYKNGDQKDKWKALKEIFENARMT